MTTIASRPAATVTSVDRAVVDTRKVARRLLRFRGVAELEREVERLIQGERSGRLVWKGNWTLGQILGHIASWIEYFYSGFPMGPAPLGVRLFGKLMKGRFLNKGLTAGFRLPKAREGTYGTERLSTDAGALKLRAALGRLKDGQPPRHASPVFGPMSVDEVTRLTLRHAELHLGFVDC